MGSKITLMGAVVLVSLVISPVGLTGETAKDKAVNDGARQLSADEIAGLIVGKTATATLGEKQFHFFYGRDNVLSGKLIGGDWADDGYYGITDDDRVCLSMTSDAGRLRCLTLLEADGVVTKYNAAGDATFTIVEFQEGNRL